MDRIKGATLIETLIASVIVSISFTIGIVIYMNVLSSSINRQYIQAAAIAQEAVVRIQNNESTDHINLPTGYSLVIEKNLYRYYDNVWQYTIRVEGEKGTLAEQHKLTYEP